MNNLHMTKLSSDMVLDLVQCPDAMGKQTRHLTISYHATRSVELLLSEAKV